MASPSAGWARSLWLGLVATAVGMLFVLSGCGGGGETTSSLTKAQFLKEANAICAKDNAEMTTHLSTYLDDHAGRHRSEAIENKAVAVVVLPFREKEVRLLRALGLPSGEEEYVDKMLTAWEEGIERGEEDPHSLRMGGPKYAFYKSYSMGNDYGLTKCWLG